MQPAHPPTEPTGKPETVRTGDVSARQVYNVVSDTVIGVNVRRRDNLFQAVFTGVFLIVGVVLGIVVLDLGALIGGIVGAVAGLAVGALLSGAGLGVYRLVRHAGGHHD